VKKGGLLILISVLIVAMAGCSHLGKAGTPASSSPVPGQQTTPGVTTANPTGVQQNPTSQTEKFTLSPIVLYSTQLKPGNNEFPNYELGNVQIEPIMSYQDWINRGGHQPWRRDPFSI
jgi:hypothetical protein